MTERNLSIIEAIGVGKHYGSRPVLQDVHLRLHAGEVMTVIGPNGSGKSTLLRILLGLERPDTGKVFRKPGLRIGYMPQSLQLDATLPLSVSWFLGLHGNGHGSERKRAIIAIGHEVGICHLLDHSLHSLSGGERQRVLLARALLCQPELLVLDEPVQSVDVNGQAALYSLIAEVSRARGAAVLMVSHDLHLVMASTERVLCLNHHICCEGHPHQVSQDPAFIHLFGQHVADSLAVYHHHHTHIHDAPPQDGHVHG